MDVKQYFRKVREMETALLEEYPIVVSLETSDGGKPGVISEVSRFNAAKMIVEGCAVLANEQEKQQFREQHAENKRASENAEMAKRLQVAIISESDARGHLFPKKSNGSPVSGK